MRHRFYCASAPTITERARRVADIYPDVFPADNVKRFIFEQIPNFLTSAGEMIPKDAVKTNHLGMRRFAKSFPSERANFFLEGCNFAVDNGGFQVTKCLVPKEHLDGYRRDFHEFVAARHADFDFTFTLDMVPAVPEPGKPVPCLFETATEMYDFNARSYEEAASLPDAPREKMRCVFHFRGPRVFRTWTKVLFDNGLAARFTHYATGGLVGSPGVKRLPVIGFTIPLVPLLVLSKTLGRSSFDFHVLGQAQPMAIVTMRLVEEHIRAVHGIDVHFTHDATSPIMESCARLMMFVDSQTLTIKTAKLDSDNAHLYFDDGRSAVDALYDIINNDLGPYGIGPFDPKRHLYQAPDGTLTTLGYMLGYVNEIYNRSKLWRWAGGIARDCYPIYAAGDKVRFASRLAEVAGDVICPQRHDNQVAGDAATLVATLDFITRLDPDYADSLVCSRLINEEHPDLRGNI
jgi:hypothetical protein